MTTAELKEKIIAWIIDTDDRQLLERISDLIERYNKEDFKVNLEDIEATSNGL